MRLISWLVRAFILFTLFAFSLNNQQTVEVHWFFGFEWRTRMVFVVLAAFSVGCALGMIAMLPGWWRRRQRPPSAAAAAPPPPPATVLPSDFVPESRLREGL